VSSAFLASPPPLFGAWCLRLLAVFFFLFKIGRVHCGSIPEALLLHRVPLAPLCMNGSPSTMFWRNCSANWDSKGEDYCPKGGTEDPVTWIIVFPSVDISKLLNASSQNEPRVAPTHPSGSYCYSHQSCSSRSPDLTGVTDLPSVAFPGGILSPYAEVNPSLYKAPVALIPYCSSDLWAGNSSNGVFYFQGLSIAQAAIQALIDLPERWSLGLGDEVIIVGPSGISVIWEALVRAISNGAREKGKPPPKLSFVCDGCTLLKKDLLPLHSLHPLGQTSSCTTDSDCPPYLGLPLGATLWGAPTAFWENFTLEGVLDAFSFRENTTLLLVALGGDGRMLSSYGMWKAGWQSFVIGTIIPYFAELLEGARTFQRQGSGIFFSSICTWPPTLTLSPAAYYRQLEPCKDGDERPHNDTLSQVLPALYDCSSPGTPSEFCISCAPSFTNGSISPRSESCVTSAPF